jgi:hypothetical protein
VAAGVHAASSIAMTTNRLIGANNFFIAILLHWMDQVIFWGMDG